jgi:Rhs element Vgr protein
MSSGFNIELNGSKYRMDNFTLRQAMLAHNALSFTIHKGPDENIKEAMFEVCGEIIGKPITMTLQTENIENLSLNSDNDSTADIEFKGFIVSAQGSRNASLYSIQVEARSWDAALNDNLNCKSFENMTLNDIVSDVTEAYSGDLDTEIDSRFTEPIPYTVQYNETNFQFLRRLARRYGEWFFNDGTQLVFGLLPQKDEVRLSYPSKDITNYNVELMLDHTAFNHVASSYNAYDSQEKDGYSEMLREYNSLSEKVFIASQERFTKETIQNMHSGGYANDDSRDTVLNISTKTQARAEKARMLSYTGKTYSSKLKIGSTLVIIDNYITNSATNEKSPVEQDEIMIIELVHKFAANESYSNQFRGVPSKSDFPPYTIGEVYPVAPSCRAKVTDNEDPNNLGRVRVQFDWQAQQDSEMMTPWLRIAQPYAGVGKGFSFIPEIGEEVMVDFEGGNAERPYVKGMLFNGVDNPDGDWLPNGNSSNQIKAIRTRNGHTIEIHDEGQDGYIRIYDNEKENYILTFSTDEKLIKLESTGNIELYAKNDIIMHADHDMEITVGNNRRLTVGSDDNNSIGKNQSLHIGESMSEDVGENKTMAIGDDYKASIGKNSDTEVGKNAKLIVADKLSVKATNTLQVSEQKTQLFSNTSEQKADSSLKIDGGMGVDIHAELVKIS